MNLDAVYKKIHEIIIKRKKHSYLNSKAGPVYTFADA